MLSLNENHLLASPHPSLVPSTGREAFSNYKINLLSLTRAPQSASPSLPTLLMQPLSLSSLAKAGWEEGKEVPDRQTRIQKEV